jgi:hypothetical protein
LSQKPKIGDDQRSGDDRRSGFDRRSGLDRRLGFSNAAAINLDRDLPRMPDKASLRHETMLINEISLVLAEKRTSLSVMRTGLAVLALPLSVLSVLIVISRYYDPSQVMYLLGPLLVICAGLTVLGIHLIIAALRRIRALNRVNAVLKDQNTHLRELNLAMKEGKSPAPDRDF